MHLKSFAFTCQLKKTVNYPSAQKEMQLISLSFIHLNEHTHTFKHTHRQINTGPFFNSFMVAYDETQSETSNSLYSFCYSCLHKLYS